MKPNIFFQILYFIFIFFICLYNSSEEQTFKAFQLDSNEVIIITKSGIFYQDKDFSIEPTKKISFNSYLYLSSGNLELISISQFPKEEKSYILCRIKNTIFLISPDFENYYDINITSLPNDYINIVPYKYENNSFIYFINYINKLNEKYKNKI